MLALNPYAFKLERKDSRIYDIKTRPSYEKGPYKSYKYANRYYCTCRGNIILMETSDIPVEMIDALIKDKEPRDYTRYRFRNIKEIYKYALECAKAIGFNVMEG